MASIQPNTLEYNVLFILTIVLLIIKFGIAFYLGLKLIQRNKERGSFQADFLFGLFITVVGLFVSRLLYMIFDFYLTEFDSNSYYIYPNIIVWKIAGLIDQSCFTVFLFIIDKQLLNFKFKGIFAYLLIGITLFQIFYPVHSAEEFELISAVGVAGVVILLVVPIIFLYIGYKSPRLRVSAILFVSGLILFFIGSNLLSESILAPIKELYGVEFQITIIFISLLLKIAGLLLATYSGLKFYV